MIRKIILALLITDIIALVVFIGVVLYTFERIEQLENEFNSYEITEELEVKEPEVEEVQATLTQITEIEAEQIEFTTEINELECEKLCEIDTFKTLGTVKYGGYRWTWYSQRVLPGGGLKIEGRHVEDRLVKDIDGYICVASGFLDKGTVVDTPLGIKGKVYDYCETPNTIDIYTDF